MTTKIDNGKYDAYSRSFLKAMSKHIEHSLAETKLSKNEKKELVSSLVFNLACLLDGSGSVEHKKKALVPRLAFQLDGEESAVIDDGSIALHELCDPS